MEGLLNGGEIAGGNDVPLETGGRVDGKAGFVQRDGDRIVKPGVNGGFGHLISHQGDYLIPHFRSGVHGLTSFT